jgi:hypothetical protein
MSIYWTITMFQWNTEFFTFVDLFNPHNDSTSRPHCSPIQRLSSFSTLPQLISNRAKNWAWFSYSRVLLIFPPYSHLLDQSASRGSSGSCKLSRKFCGFNLMLCHSCISVPLNTPIFLWTYLLFSPILLFFLHLSFWTWLLCFCSPFL